MGDIMTYRVRKPAGCWRRDNVYSDFGTRRRASFKARHGDLKSHEGFSGMRFISRAVHRHEQCYFAMKYDLVPVGTMARELICALGGMYGPQMAK